MIELNATGADFICTERTPITSGMVGAKMHFTFSEEWDDLSKTVVVSDGAVTKEITQAHENWGEGDIITLSQECMTTAGRSIKIGVYGTDGETVVMPTIYCHSKNTRLR